MTNFIKWMYNYQMLNHFEKDEDTDIHYVSEDIHLMDLKNIENNDGILI